MVTNFEKTPMQGYVSAETHVVEPCQESSSTCRASKSKSIPEKDWLERIAEHQLLENPDTHCSLHNGTKQRNIFGDIVTSVGM